MPLTDDYDGTYPSGITLTITPPGEAPTTIDIQGIENFNPPQRSHKEDKYTPISGDRAGNEQSVLCSTEVSNCSATLTYEKERQMALDAVCGTNGCTIVLTLADGYTLTGTGGLRKIGMARLEDSRHVTSDVEFTIAGNWVGTDAA
jgi:hypothetical protein